MRLFLIIMGGLLIWEGASYFQRRSHRLGGISPSYWRAIQIARKGGED